MKQTNNHFQYSITIDSTQTKVWDLLIDVARWKDWDTEISEASLSGEFREGARGMLTPKKGPKLTFHISEVIPGKSYTFNTKMPVGDLEIRRFLIQEKDHTLFTDEIRFTGMLKNFFGFLLGRKFRSVLPEVMHNFKKLAEQ